MHPDLTLAFNQLVSLLQQDTRCLGGWHYGSVGRGDTDEYSDYDPVFLIPNTHFEAFAKDYEAYISQVCDELLLTWPEDYNSPVFKNFCHLIRIGEHLHQLDFFILNADHTEDWWCRQHLKGCTPENLIFDRDGSTTTLLDKGLRTDNHIPDTRRCIDTYWFHLEMLVKYFKRGDHFKLIKNIDILFHAHVDLLLSQYDTLDYGAWETKVKHCVPSDAQKNLLLYYQRADLDSMATSIKQAMKAFHQDAHQACLQLSITYPEHIATTVIDFFNREIP